MKKADTTTQTALVRSSAAEYLTFIAATGQGGVEAVYADENVWLTQKMMAQLYDVDVRTVNYHLKKVFSDSELQAEAAIRKFRITASDGKSYDTQHYNLAAIIAVGYKVNSERALQFRKWATTIVEEFAVKGYTMDDQRLKSGGSVLTERYFEEQLQRVREIRLSEQVLPEDHRHLRHVHRLRRDGASHQTLLRHGAEQAAQGHPRADGSRSRPYPRRRQQAAYGTDHVDGCVIRKNPEVRCGGRQELFDRRRNGATFPAGERVSGCG